MTDKRILVIDDSATIRKLVDTHLSPAGYDVTLAPNAEDGLELAAQIVPDLILLDHQLPGTTGAEVCGQLLADTTLATIPVVVSSTLRKKAYVEYAEMDNVVDMLPKPYTEDLLITTVANAIETAEMVVASQSKGSAVPEIIGDADEPDLSGSLSVSNLREVVDFLNNGTKQGVLELEGDRLRFLIYLSEGRIQGMSATGLGESDVEQIVQSLPESLVNLAEVLRLTIAGRGGADFDGFMQLLDRRVLDPRLTTKLLRYQAAMLMGCAFDRKLSRFQFRTSQKVPALHQDLPLQISLLGLLIENAMYCPESDLLDDDAKWSYVRQSIRGQNLDRSGVSARHMKILNLLSEPCTIDELQSRIDWERDEIRRVLHALVLGGILERSEQASGRKFVIYEPSTVIAGKLRGALKQNADGIVGKVVRDQMTLQLMLTRTRPDAVFFAVDSPQACRPIRQASDSIADSLKQAETIVFAPQAAIDDANVDWSELLGFVPDQIIAAPYTPQTLLDAMNGLSDRDVESMEGTCEASEGIAPSIAVAANVDSQTEEALS